MDLRVSNPHVPVACLTIVRADPQTDNTKAGDVHAVEVDVFQLPILGQISVDQAPLRGIRGGARTDEVEVSYLKPADVIGVERPTAPAIDRGTTGSIRRDDKRIGRVTGIIRIKSELASENRPALEKIRSPGRKSMALTLASVCQAVDGERPSCSSLPERLT